MRYLFFLIIISGVSCKKFVQIDLPQSRITTENVFKDEKTATGALLGIYRRMTESRNLAASGSDFSITNLCALSADEMDTYSATYAQLPTNQLTPTVPVILTAWSSAYNLVYVANQVIEGVAASNSLNAATKTRLDAEAKFMRAFFHFYLTNLWGDIPLVTTTDYRVNAVTGRTPASKVYEQIIKDLEEAQANLSEEYVSADRGRINKWTVAALLSRVYLYLGEWEKAESLASSIIGNAKYELVTDLNKVFISTSKEVIWHTVMPANNIYDTQEGYYYILTANPTGVVLREDFALNSFETGDNRRANWISTFTGNKVYYYAFKYKIKRNSGTRTEHSVVFRLAEQYLIRAEARAHLDKLTGANSAESDINAIRSRAGLPGTTAVTQPQLLSAIGQERKVELFTEWGHRWFDLKRTNRANAVLGAIKPGWDPTDVLFPIPEIEMNNNPNLQPQNPGF